MDKRMNVLKSEDYENFLARKAIIDPPTGMHEIPHLPAILFPFQKDIVSWALRRGRAAIFAGTGLGKSLMELSWADTVAQHTGKPVIVLTPLAVAAQMIREGEKFGITAHHVTDGAQVCEHGIYVTNYHKLEHFDLSVFGGVVLDESSILKSHDGKTRNWLISECQKIPFRLAATATPAPNDFMELGNHAEFLGCMSYTDMLSTFFTHDGGSTQDWRLRGHAASDFWRWMCSWAVMLRHPRDLGYEASNYDLPHLRQHQVTVRSIDAVPHDGMLFAFEAQTMQERIKARKNTISERVNAAAKIVSQSDDYCVIWCNLNDESSSLAAAIPGSVEVRGSDKEDDKERKLEDFSKGKTRVLITKPSICGFGMNWQHCNKTVFVGLNDSFEQVYQAIRRFWRFGQTRDVDVYFIAADIEGAVVANLKRKERDADHMAQMMVNHMADLSSEVIRGSSRTKAEYNPLFPVKIPHWLEGNAA